VEDVVRDGKRTTRLLRYLGPIKTDGDVESYRKMLSLKRGRRASRRQTSGG
jgi:hypothetical protein